jgi:4-carboxymuconolactone decarboxylase
VTDERRERGAALAEKLAPGFEAGLQEKFGDFAPDLIDFTMAYPFGDVYSRPGLDLRSRQLVTVSALVALGALEQLRTHVQICRQIGMTSEEVGEIIIQLSVYAGWPRALSAAGVAAEVFAEV